MPRTVRSNNKKKTSVPRSKAGERIVSRHAVIKKNEPSARSRVVSKKAVPNVSRSVKQTVATKKTRSNTAPARAEKKSSGPEIWGTLTVGFLRCAEHKTVQRFVTVVEKGVVVGGMLLFLSSVLFGAYAVTRAATPGSEAVAGRVSPSAVAVQLAACPDATNPQCAEAPAVGNSNAITNLNKFAPSKSGSGGAAPSLSGIIMGIISVLLGLLGTYFFGLMLYAGWLWMNAQGESDPVEKAKKIFTESAIGLLIILSAQFVSFFVLNQLIQVVTGQP